MKIGIAIATYNEKENIEKLIRQIEALNLSDLAVVIVDDNSPDGTAEVVENLKKEFGNLYLIKRPGKLGYGSAHVAAFKKALALEADIIISLDADLSHNPEVIPEMVKNVNDGYDVVIGSRRVIGGRVVDWSLWRKFCSAGAMFISKLLLGIKVHDLTSGFRAYRKEIFERINLDQVQSNGYSFLEELIYLIEKNKFKVKEIPIVFYDRRLGHSKLSKLEIMKFFTAILKIKFKK